MQTTRVLIIASALALAACGDDEAELRRDQQQYEVVQEGAGGPVAGTIGGPGEAPPPVMPALTGTNADTTSAFTLPTATAPATSAPPGTIAGTLPREPVYTPRPSRPRPSTPAPAPTPGPAPQPVDPPAPQPAPEPEPVDDAPEPEPQPEPQPQPAPPPPPPTNT